MRELKYDFEMQDGLYLGESIKWIFPKNVQISKDALYEVEYQIIKDTQNSSCIYKVTYIKPVSSLIERINYIINTFNQTNKADDFEKWFRKRYKLQVII